MLETRNVRPTQAGRYYSQDNYTRALSVEEASLWVGKASKYLKLNAEVNPNDLSNILKGFTQDGEALRHHWAQQSGKEIGALDAVFTAPKSVSLLGVVQGAEGIFLAHQLAVKESLRVAEERLTRTRFRLDGELNQFQTQNMAIAVFWHDTSREIDPHLHSHCLVMNCTYVAQKSKWYSLDNRAIHDHKKWLGQLYQHELARHIQELGFGIEVKPHGQFEVKGFTDHQLLHFSKRLQQIQPLLSDGTWRDRQRAASITRAPKGEVFDKRELLDVWTKECDSIGIEFPEPLRLATIAPSTLRFYELDSQQPIEEQEQQLFLKTSAPFHKIEEAIAVNLPVMPISQDVVSNRKKIKELLDFNRVDEAIALLEDEGCIVVGNDAQSQMIQEWSALLPDQRFKSALLVGNPETISEEARKALELNEGFGEPIMLRQRVYRSKTCLKIGDFIEPLRTHRKRHLETDTLYQLKAFRSRKLELASPDGGTFITKNDFRYRVWTGRDYPVYELEPLVWTDPHWNQSEFAIISVEEENALIQYRDGDLASVDIKTPLPVHSAIAQSELPPGQFEKAYVLCDETVDLKHLLKQCQTVKLYGPDVKSIADAAKTFIARHDSIYSVRRAFEQELEQEQPVGKLRDFGSLSAFRDKHRPAIEEDGAVLMLISRRVRTTGQWRRLQRDERLTRALSSVIGSLRAKIDGFDDYRAAVEDLCSVLNQTITRNRARKVAQSFQTRQVAKTLTPLLQKVHQSLQAYEQAVQEKQETMAALTAAVEATTHQLQQKELIAIAQQLRAQIPNSRFAQFIAGEFQVETRSLTISVKGDRVAIASKEGRGLLAEFQGTTVVLNQLSERDMEICRRIERKIQPTEKPKFRL